MGTQETIESLRAALADAESGGGPADFAEGHGFPRRLSPFSWRAEALSAAFRLPWGRPLSGELSDSGGDFQGTCP